MIVPDADVWGRAFQSGVASGLDQARAIVREKANRLRPGFPEAAAFLDEAVDALSFRYQLAEKQVADMRQKSETR